MQNNLTFILAKNHSFMLKTKKKTKFNFDKNVKEKRKKYFPISQKHRDISYIHITFCKYRK